MTNDLPNGWDMAKLEDVVDILDSKRVPINSKERETRKGSVPYYGATGQVNPLNLSAFPVARGQKFW